MIKKLLAYLFIIYANIVCLGQQAVVLEPFDDNNNFWNVNENDSYAAKIQNGKYFINHKDSLGANLFWNNNLGLDYDGNFQVSTSYQQLTGSIEYGHGLVWGGLDGSNFYAFTISSSGVANIYKFEDGDYINILEPVDKSEFIHGLGRKNLLTVQRDKDQIFFLINGNLIYSELYQENFGNKVGLVLNTKMKIAVDWLKITNGLNKEEQKIEQPEIVWVTPELQLTSTKEDYIDVEVGILAHNHLNKVNFYVNGLLVSTTDYKDKIRGEQLVEDDIFDEIISEKVTLQLGINYLKVVLKDFDGHTVTSKRIVKSSYSTVQSHRKDYALFFATDEYAEWSGLNNPINDADTIADILQNQYGFETEVVHNPSRETILEKLYAYNTKEYGKYDQLLIVFAGHGKYDYGVGMGYIVCTDSKKVDRGNSSYISYSELQNFTNNSHCNHLCLTMDVCFGGDFKTNYTSQVMRGDKEKNIIYQDISKGEYIYRKLESKTRKYIASGEHFVPDGLPGSHSPFARKVINGLGSHGGEDGILTFSELLHYMERVKPQPLYGSYGSDEAGSEFLFIAR